MGYLHEILAVEPDLASQAQNAINEAKQTLGNATKLIGRRKTYRPYDEDGVQMPPESSEVSTTVAAELDRVYKAFGRWLDASMEKETTNTVAKAEIEIGGELFELPATALLNLESKLTKLLALAREIPTNDLAIKWQWDDEAQVYVSIPQVTHKTEKVLFPIVGYEATPEHPAQVEYASRNDPVGEYTTVILSGMYRPSDKRQLISRLEVLILRVKRARQRANMAEVEASPVWEAIERYLKSG